MASDNETVEQACESICELVIAIHDKEHNEKQEIKNVWHIVQQVKDRILAAHKREMMHNESLIQKAGATVVELMNEMNAQHEEIKKLRGLVVLLASALEIATVMRCVKADSGIPCKDLLVDDSCGAENCKSMCGGWRELIARAKKELTK